jgi:cell division protein FtsB
MNDKELENILNFVLNNMGNAEMMKLVRLQEVAQIYYLKCEKLQAENAKLNQEIEKLKRYLANWENDDS